MAPWSDYPSHQTYVGNDGSPRAARCKACNNAAQIKRRARNRKVAAKLTDAELATRTAQCPDCGQTKSWNNWDASYQVGPGGCPTGACRDCFNAINNPRCNERNKLPHNRVNHQLKNFVWYIAKATGTPKDQANGKSFEWTGYTERQLMDHLGDPPDDGK